jgi:hypothetical protein
MKIRSGIFVVFCLFCVMQLKASVTLMMGQHYAQSGAQIQVPVTVKDFNNIISIQGTIEFNPQILNFVSVQGFNLPGMNASNFGISETQNGKLMFSWFEGNLNGQYLQDSSHIFTIVFSITGNVGQQSQLTFGNTPTSLEIINSYFQSEQIVLINGLVDVQQSPVYYDLIVFSDTLTVLPGSNIQIPVRAVNFNNIVSMQGTISFDPAVADFVSVSGFGLPGMNTSDFGYSQTGNGLLTYSWNDPLINGVSLNDSSVLFLMNFYVTGSNGQSSQISFTGLPVPLEIADTSLQPLSVLYNNGLLQIQQDIQWEHPLFMLDSISAPNGALVNASVRAINFDHIVSFQGTIEFDENIVLLTNVTNYGLPGMSISDFGMTLISQGKIMFSWTDPLLTGVTVADSSVLFSLNFMINGTQGDTSQLNFTNFPTSLECTDTGFTPVFSGFIHGLIEIEGDAMVAITNPTELNYCTGDSIHLNYTASGSYIPGNIFILIISDQYGSFSNPLHLDTIYAVSDSSFHTIIPLNLPSGIGYRLRVISTNPVTASNINFSDLTVFSTQSAPSIPSGLSDLCENPSNTTYTIPAVPGASSYIWTLTPLGAGTIAPSGTSAVIDWDNTFTGTASLTVIAENGNCQSGTSVPLQITVTSVPGTPSIPAGLTELCENPSNTTYTIPAVPGASSYMWTLSPSGAGTITPSGTSAVIDWNDTFTGTVSIAVTAVNGSCQSGTSVPLQVTVTSVPATPSIPAGLTDLCENPSNTTYTIPAVPGASSYMWTLTPSGAGTIAPSGTSAVIDWNDTFTGVVLLTVVAENGNCQSGTSVPLQVTVTSVPGTPSPPAGLTELCENPSNTTYTIPAVPGASSYMWTLTPSGAGTITPSGTSAVIDWDNTFTGTASLTVIAENGSCQSGISVPLQITVTSVPATPSTPSGLTDLCENPSNTTYTILAVPVATSYIWTLTPSGAGTITPSGTSAVIDWNDIFTGTASLTVIAENGSCQSGISVPLQITVTSVPATPSTPSGLTDLCENPSNTTYTIPAVPFVTSYLWTLTPSGAGTITPSGTSAVIDWNDTFTGNASIAVTAVNGSCQSGISVPLQVTVTSVPATPSTPSGLTDLCENPSNTTYTIPAVPGATSYLWTLTPSGAGTITPSGTSAIIDWDDIFTGVATLEVAAQNGNCQGAFSTGLQIEINAYPGIPVQPIGDTIICVGVISSVYLTSDPLSATYNWVVVPSNAGTISVSGNQATITWNPLFTGSAGIVAQGQNNCGIGLFSDTLFVEIFPLPIPPVIIFNGIMLISDYPTGNQWYFNGNPIPGATDQTYLVLQNGLYFVQYTDMNGCSSVSDSINITTVEVLSVALTGEPKIYPNPCSDVLYIEMQISDDCIASIYDITGKLIFNRKLSSGLTEIDIRFIERGMYIVRVQYNHKTINRKIHKH